MCSVAAATRDMGAGRDRRRRGDLAWRPLLAILQHLLVEAAEMTLSHLRCGLRLVDDPVHRV